MEVSGQLHAPAAVPPGKEPPVPTDETSQMNLKQKYPSGVKQFWALEYFRLSRQFNANVYPISCITRRFGHPYCPQIQTKWLPKVLPQKSIDPLKVSLPTGYHSAKQVEQFPLSLGSHFTLKTETAKISETPAIQPASTCCPSPESIST